MAAPCHNAKGLDTLGRDLYALDPAFPLTQTLPAEPLIGPFVRTMAELGSNTKQFNYSNKLFSSCSGKVGILTKPGTLEGEREGE